MVFACFRLAVIDHRAIHPSLRWTPVTPLDTETVLLAARSCEANLRPGSRRLAATRRLTLAAGGVLLVFSAASFAQPAKPVVNPAAANAAIKPPTVVAPAKPVVTKPVWAELTVQQQTALRPLSPGWDTINEAQKRKWLEISKGYPSLTPEGQTIMHSRMTEWVGLSAQQRAQARLNFAKTKELSNELTPEEKQAKWQSYQALSIEEKQKLAAKATPKPTGAATAVKPVAPQKLAVTRSAQAPQASNVPPGAAAPAPAVQGGNSALSGEGMGGANSLQKR